MKFTKHFNVIISKPISNVKISKEPMSNINLSKRPMSNVKILSYLYTMYSINVFIILVVRQSNNLPGEVVSAPSLSAYYENIDIPAQRTLWWEVN